MRTYSAIWDDSGTRLFEGLDINEAAKKIPAGSKIVSGDKIDKYGNIIEKRAVYRDAKTLKTFSLIEDKPKTTTDENNSANT